MVHHAVICALGAGLLATPPIDGSDGASGVWTSQEPMTQQVRDLILAGRLDEATSVLSAAPEAKDEATRRLRAEAVEMIRRLRWEYGRDAEGLLQRLRASIPDVSQADLEQWRAGGQLQWRMIDGRIGYFRHEPLNLFRFSEQARQRREAAAGTASRPANTASSSQAALLTHLREAVHQADSIGRPLVVPMRHHIRYRVTVQPNRPGARPGSRVRCWLPFPQEYRQQDDIRLLRTIPEKHKIAPVGRINGSPKGAIQRSVYLEQQMTDPARPMVFEEEFEYRCAAYCPPIREYEARAAEPGQFQEHLRERPPHIVFTPEMRTLARRIVGDESNPLTRARKIFHHIVEHIRYCTEEEYSLIPSLSQKAIRTGRGDCGVQSMLFITLCRLAGVPARWQSGWFVQPENWNLHDWAECYVEPWGWLPVDVSFGLKPSDDPVIREFYFGRLDAYRLIVNLDYGAPLDPPKQHLRSEPADFQRGELELDDRNLYFDEWDWEIEINRPG